MSILERIRGTRHSDGQAPEPHTRGQPSIETSTPDELGYLKRRNLLGWVVVNVLLVLTALVAATAQLLTLFHARRFVINTVVPTSARLVLRILSIEVRFHGFDNLPQPCLVTANHTSSLDMFLTPLFPIPNMRVFLARWLQVHPALFLISRANGTIYTVPQKYPEQRATLFQKAEHTLRDSGDSCLLSPEGTRRTDGVINPFNKGTFHLATNLGWPIVPVYIDISRRMNPGVGLATRPGVIHIYARPPIDTTDWKLEDLIANKEAVRDQYVAFPEGWKSE